MASAWVRKACFEDKRPGSPSLGKWGVPLISGCLFTLSLIVAAYTSGNRLQWQSFLLYNCLLLWQLSLSGNHPWQQVHLPRSYFCLLEHALSVGKGAKISLWGVKKLNFLSIKCKYAHVYIYICIVIYIPYVYALYINKHTDSSSICGIKTS